MPDLSHDERDGSGFSLILFSFSKECYWRTHHRSKHAGRTNRVHASGRAWARPSTFGGRYFHANPAYPPTTGLTWWRWTNQAYSLHHAPAFVPVTNTGMPNRKKVERASAEVGTLQSANRKPSRCRLLLKSEHKRQATMRTKARCQAPPLRCQLPVG